MKFNAKQAASKDKIEQRKTGGGTFTAALTQDDRQTLAIAGSNCDIGSCVDSEKNFEVPVIMATNKANTKTQFHDILE